MRPGTPDSGRPPSGTLCGWWTSDRSATTTGRRPPRFPLALIALADDDEQMRLRVVCYSGRKEDERPVRFQLGDYEYFVEEVVDQWYGPDDTFFKVRTSDNNVYVLRRRSSTPEGEWSLESSRDYTAGR